MGALSLVMAASALASAGRGLNRPSKPASSGSGVGYGKGWVSVSGQADGPIQGYLFHINPDNGRKSDVATIWDPANPFPYAFAHGVYRGCGRIYGKSNLWHYSRTPKPAARCRLPGTKYTHRTKPTRQQFLYCTEPALNRLCTPRGAYDDNQMARVTVPAACPIFANVGGQMFTGLKRPATPRNHLARVPAAVGAVGVRYVTKDGQWALGKFPVGTFTSYPDMKWAFIPTSCGL